MSNDYAGRAGIHPLVLSVESIYRELIKAETVHWLENEREDGSHRKFCPSVKKDNQDGSKAASVAEDISLQGLLALLHNVLLSFVFFVAKM